jgi:hypothetical protein
MKWWAFWGIIFAACPAGKGGQCLFKTAKGRKLVANLNFGKGGMDVMSWTRHQDIPMLFMTTIVQRRIHTIQ